MLKISINISHQRQHQHKQGYFSPDKLFLFKKSKSSLELLLYDGGHSLVILAIASHLSSTFNGDFF